MSNTTTKTSKTKKVNEEAETPRTADGLIDLETLARAEKIDWKRKDLTIADKMLLKEMLR